MDNAEIVGRLRKILQRELAEREQAIRSRDTVRALNDLADASKALKSLIGSLATERDGDEPGPIEPPVGETEPD
ncbi:MAG: hypothetical protein ABUS57_05585 [Pseudomonadota bacterium]